MSAEHDKLNDKNEIFHWGENQYRQLRRDYKSGEYLKPEKVDFFDGKNIIEISYGENHCLALSSNGLIYGWGRNNFGQIGCGEERGKYISTPIEIHFKERIKFIHCTRFMSIAVCFDGSAYYWGTFGSFSKNFETLKKSHFTPRLIPIENISRVYSDSYEALIILLENGKLLEFNVMNEEFIEIECEEEFNDLFNDYYYLRNYYILQQEECIYQLEKNGSEFKLIKTDSINFFDFYLQKETKYRKTIEITKEGYLMEYQIHIDYEKNILNLNNEYIFERKYINMFEEIKEIGAGGFGTVNQVLKKSNNILYAIKKIEGKGDIDLNEINLISKLNTNFVVQYIDSWIEVKAIFKNLKKYLFIQMEMCSQNLREFVLLMNEINEETFLTFKYFISYEVFKELIECVNYLHSLSPPIIHRDLKPENILISDDIINGRFLKLCDFGLSQIHEKSFHTRMVGTDAYMAPEVRNGKQYNLKADIYSLALIATEIFQLDVSLKEIKRLSNLIKYSNKFENTIFETHFRQVLPWLQLCISKSCDERPESKQLLDRITEYDLDKNSVKNDLNISNFLEKLNHLDNYILKLFFEMKLDSSIVNITFIERTANISNVNNPPSLNSFYATEFNEICEIGVGNFGKVFEVQNKLTNQVFAIKKIRIQNQTDLNEMQIISILNSKSNDFIVKIIDMWTERKHITNKSALLFIQMELCSQNLRDFIKLLNTSYELRFHALYYIISCEIFKELIECVNYLHSMNPPIIHRDLKPENILISDGINGRFLKLCDFGLSKIHEISWHTRMVGTDSYMAPEVRDGEHYNLESDIYSLALIGTEIFRFGDKVKTIRKENIVSKYSNIYCDTKLRLKFNSLLKTLSQCLSMEYNLRPDSKQLKNSINEWTIDSNTINMIIDENISDIHEILEKNSIIKNFFEAKLRKFSESIL